MSNSLHKLLRVICREPSISIRPYRSIHAGFKKNLSLLKSNQAYAFAKRNHHAAVLHEIGSNLQLQNVKRIEKIKDDEIRLDVYSCGVNAVDVLISSSQYPAEISLPFTPGYELSGEITEVGKSVNGLKEGDRVIALNKEKFGGFAEELVLNSQDVWIMPQSMPFDEAAALTDCYSSALIAVRRANLKAGDLVLVTAAAGGLGLAAVDIAANLYKAKVIGACGTNDKASLVREKGAFATVNYNSHEVVKAVKEFSNGKGVKIVFDAVGGEMFESLLTCVSFEGSIVVAGFASRQIPAIKTSQLLPRSCALIGVSLTEYRNAASDVYRDTVQEVISLYSESYISPYISKTFPMPKINEAMDFVRNQKSTGKVVIDVR